MRRCILAAVALSVAQTALVHAQFNVFVPGSSFEDNRLPAGGFAQVSTAPIPFWTYAGFDTGSVGISYFNNRDILNYFPDRPLLNPPADQFQVAFMNSASASPLTLGSTPLGLAQAGATYVATAAVGRRRDVVNTGGTYIVSIAINGVPVASSSLPIESVGLGDFADLPVSFTNTTGLTGPVQIALSYQSPSVFSQGLYDNVRLTNSGVTYQGSGSGNWTDPVSFGGSVPNTADAIVVLGSSLNAPSTVTSNSNVTVGTLRFSSPVSYTLAGTGSLNLSTTTVARSLVAVDQGSHTLSLPLNLTKDTQFLVAAGAGLKTTGSINVGSSSGGGDILVYKDDPGTLTFSGPVNAQSHTLFVINAGDVNFDAPNSSPNLDAYIDSTAANLNVSGNQTLGSVYLRFGNGVLRAGRSSSGTNVPANVSVGALNVVTINGTGANGTIDTPLSSAAVTASGVLAIDPGSSLNKTGAGVLSARQIIGNSLVVSDGTVVATGGVASPSVLSSLSIQPGATFDLGRSDLILKSGAASTETVRGWILNGALKASASNASSLNYTPFTGLALFVNDTGDGANPYFTTFDGIAGLQASDAIVKYTYIGDTDLDGILDGADFKNVMEGYVTGRSGWYWGDTDNSGGVVTAADVNLFLSAYSWYQSQTNPPGFGALSGSIGAQIPEPSAATASLAGVPLIARRRRSR